MAANAIAPVMEDIHPHKMRSEITVVVQVITMISCCLSMIGSCIIVITYLIWKDIRTQSRQHLVFLSVTDFLAALGFFYGILEDFRDNSPGCIAQSGLTTFSNTSSFFWTVSIAVYLYITIVQSNAIFADRLTPVFHVISWGVPLVIVISALAAQGLGYDDSFISVGWCWVDLKHPQFLLWMLMTAKVWEFIAYIILPVLYFLIRRHIYIQSKLLKELNIHREAVSAMNKVENKLTFIPAVFIILRIWGTLRFILYLCGSSAVQSEILVVLHGIGNTFQGGANCILFCLLTPKIRNKLLECFCILFRGRPSTCCRRGGCLTASELDDPASPTERAPLIT